MYNQKQWATDGTLRPKEGEQISIEVFDQIFNALPPERNTRTVFQMGEAWDHVVINNKMIPRFYTFIKNDKKWYYIGKCINDEKYINELISITELNA